MRGRDCFRAITGAEANQFGLEIAQRRTMASTMSLQGVPGAATQPARRAAASGSVLPHTAALHRAARPAGQPTQQLQASRQRSSLRVRAAQAAPPQTTGTGGGAEAVDDSGVFDVVVVGAGLSGLTTAQVRRRRCCCCGIFC